MAEAKDFQDSSHGFFPPFFLEKPSREVLMNPYLEVLMNPYYYDDVLDSKKTLELYIPLLKLKTAMEHELHE